LNYAEIETLRPFKTFSHFSPWNPWLSLAGQVVESLKIAMTGVPTGLHPSWVAKDVAGRALKHPEWEIWMKMLVLMEKYREKHGTS